MLRFERQPSLLVLHFWLADGVMSAAQQAAYLRDGPTATERREDGSGVVRLVVDGQPEVVEIPAGSTWVEVRGLTDDEDLAAYEAAEPLDVAGMQVAAQLDKSRETARLFARAEVGKALDRWQADHRLRLDCTDEAGDEDLPPSDLERARSVRARAAREALVDLVVRAIRWPLVGEHRDLLERAAADADDDLAKTIRRAIAALPPKLAQQSLDAGDLLAVRRHNAYSKRLARARAERGLVALHHPQAAGLDRRRRWQLIVDAPEEVREPVIAELCAHIDRIGTASPKAAPASSPVSG